MKKIKLNIKHEENLPDTIIGISSTYKDYQIAWAINNYLPIKLSKSKDISVRLKKDNESIFHFSIFSYTDLDENNFFLLSNNDGGANLYSKYRNIDYFFIIKSENSSTSSILQKILQSDFIIGCFTIPVNNILKKIIQKVIEE